MSRERASLAVAGIAAWLLAFAAAPAIALQPETTLISRAGGFAGADANGDSYGSAVSADGRVVAFHSVARNLSPDDRDGMLDVYVRDRLTGETTLVSRATGADGSKSDGDSASPQLSGDGRLVAFESYGRGLSTDDGAGLDVFVRDRVSEQTLLVSRASGVDGMKADNESGSAALSADGRFVAFVSYARNLSPDDRDATPDVFVRDLATAQTALVSRAGGARGVKGNRDSGAATPAVSSDGRFVAFDSRSSNLSADDHDTLRDVFVRDLVAGRTTLVSRATGVHGAKGNSTSGRALSISGDGRFVAFEARARNLSRQDRDKPVDVFVRDLARGRTTLVSRAGGPRGAAGDGDSINPVISADGRFVAFDSEARNLSRDDRDAEIDVFVRDLVTARTTLVSRASGSRGRKANDFSLVGGLSADGRVVAFSSYAGNLAPDDRDRRADVFVRTRLP